MSSTYLSHTLEFDDKSIRQKNLAPPRIEIQSSVLGKPDFLETAKTETTPSKAPIASKQESLITSTTPVGLETGFFS